MSNLVKHNRKHTGEKPFHCVEPGCGYSAKRSSNLETHRRKHLGERKISCLDPNCGYTTGTKRDFTVHKRKHAGTLFVLASNQDEMRDAADLADSAVCPFV